MPRNAQNARKMSCCQEIRTVCSGVVQNLAEKILRGAGALRGMFTVSHLNAREADSTVVVGHNFKERCVSITMEGIVVACRHLGSVARGAITPVNSGQLDSNSDWGAQLKSLC
jgi:hypothetical protein